MQYIRRIILFCLSISAACCCMAFGKTDTLRLYFELDKATLTKDATGKIDGWLYNDKITASKYILILGYADYLGSDGYNDTLSTNRAYTIKDYLADMGIPGNSIRMLLGKGEVKRVNETPDGYPTDRRVDVIVSDTVIHTAKNSKPVINKAVAKGSGTSVSIDKIKPGETFVLDNIYFHAGRHFVRDESMAELDKLFNVLAAHPSIVIQIEGHVCCVKAPDALDEDTWENALSVNRARFIYEYLIDRGIDKSRLSYRGFGRTRPIIADERTREEEDKNRRVEIRIMKN